MREKFQKMAKTGAVALTTVAMAACLAACSSGSSSTSTASSNSGSATQATSAGSSDGQWATKSAEELSSETVADGDWLRSIDWNSVQTKDNAASLMGIVDAPVTADNLTTLVASTSVHVAGETASTAPSISDLLASDTAFSGDPNNAIKLYLNPVEKDAYGQTFSMMFDVFPTYDASTSMTFADMVSGGQYYMVAEYPGVDTAFGVGNAATTDVDSMTAMVDTYGRPAYAADIEGQQGNCHALLWQRDGYLFGVLYNEIAVSSDNLRIDRVVYIPEASWDTVKQSLADNAQYNWSDFDDYIGNLS